MRKILLSLLVVAAMLFSGCISIGVNQKVERDGSSLVVQKFDFTNLMAYIKSSQEGSSPGIKMNISSLGEVCINVTKKDSTIICKTEGDVVTMEKRFTPEEGGYQFSKESRFPFIVYTLRVDSLPQVAQDSMDGGAMSVDTSGKFTEAAMKTSAAMLKAASVKMEYTIEMPGEIVAATNGQIVDKKAQYNVLTLIEEGKTVEVQSQEADMGAVGIVLVVLLAIVGVGAFLFFRGKPKK